MYNKRGSFMKENIVVETSAIVEWGDRHWNRSRTQT